VSTHVHQQKIAITRGIKIFRAKGEDMFRIGNFFSNLITIGSMHNNDILMFFQGAFPCPPGFFGRPWFARQPFLKSFASFFIIQKGIGVQEGIDRFVF